MSDLFSIGKTGLRVAQQGFATTGNNIANADTPGYSRQLTGITSLPTNFVGNGYVGTGVQIQNISRVVDNTAISNLQSSISRMNETQTYSSIAGRVSDLLSAPATNVIGSVGNFFNALNTLNTNAQASGPSRTALMGLSTGLASQAQTVNTQLHMELSNANSQIVQNIANLNAIATSLAHLNDQIVASAGISGGNLPNDLYDQRDQFINQLAAIVNVSTSTQTDGAMNVMMGGGHPLVVGGATNLLTTQINTSDPNQLDVILQGGSTLQTLNAGISGGALSGLLMVQHEMINPALATLGRIMLTLGSTFNAQHQLGMDQSGHLGQNYFNDVNETSATLGRSMSSASNRGTGVLAVTITAMAVPTRPPYTVIGSESGLVLSGTLNALGANNLMINGVAIQAAVADPHSNSDAAASAIAIAHAINNSQVTGITAVANPNVLALGQFTPGVLNAGNLLINGRDVSTVPNIGVNDTQTLVQAINALTQHTDVSAVADANDHITLTALDGRNIDLRTGGGVALANFTNFALNGAASHQVQAASITLTSNNQSGLVISGSTPVNARLVAGTLPATPSILGDSDYSLSYNGAQYSLTRESDGRVISQSATLNGIQGEGFSLNFVSGAMNIGDQFLIRPTKDALSNFALRVGNPINIALAAPLHAVHGGQNSGHGVVSPITMLNTTHVGTPIQIRFDAQDNTKYRVFNMTTGLQIGPVRTFVPSENIFPVPSPSPAYDPGYRLSISGTPGVGDIFTITPNNAINGDSTNGLALAALQTANILEGGTSTLNSTYGQLYAMMGSLASQANTNQSAAVSLNRAAQNLRDQISGVNLDEEAGNLVQLQQLYQAAAKVISVAQETFYALIKAIG